MKKADSAILALFEPSPSKFDLRRYKIGLAYIETLAQQGPEGATLENVATRLKMKRSHLVYYFASKHELLKLALRVITHQAQQITVSRIKDETTPSAQLEAAINASFEWAQRFPEQVSAMIAIFQTCSWDHQLRELYGEIRKQGTERLAELFLLSSRKRMTKAQAIRSAQFLQGAITGVLFSGTSLGWSREMLEHSRIQIFKSVNFTKS